MNNGRHDHADRLHRQRQLRRADGGGLFNSRRHDHADQLHRQRQLRRLDGGGLYNYGGTTTLTNCTVSGNSATATAAACTTTSGTTTLTDCTVSGNSAAANGGGLYNYRRHDHADRLHRQRQLRHGNGGGLYQRSAARPR